MVKPSSLDIVYFEDGRVSHIYIVFENWELIIDLVEGNFYDFYLN